MESYKHSNLIISGDSNVWLGDINSSRDYTFISDNNISAIINATYDIDIIKYNDIKFYRIPLGDSGDPIDQVLMDKCLPKAVNLLYKLMCNHNNILIHCMAGQQRSATIVAGFIYLYFDMSLEDTLKYIIKQRPVSFYYGKDPHFLNQLKKLK